MKKSRNLWPIAIISFFVTALIFLTTFIAWAVRQKQDLVSENYYENEMRFQQQIDKVNRTKAFAAETTVTFDEMKKVILVKLPLVQSKEATGQIHFYRPSNAVLDHAVALNLNSDGAQTLDAKSLATGFWKVRVEWSANGQDYLFDQSLVVN